MQFKKLYEEVWGMKPLDKILLMQKQLKDFCEKWLEENRKQRIRIKELEAENEMLRRKINPIWV